MHKISVKLVEIRGKSRNEFCLGKILKSDGYHRETRTFKNSYIRDVQTVNSKHVNLKAKFQVKDVTVISHNFSKSKFSDDF